MNVYLSSMVIPFVEKFLRKYNCKNFKEAKARFDDFVAQCVATIGMYGLLGMCDPEFGQFMMPASKNLNEDSNNLHFLFFLILCIIIYTIIDF